MNETTRCADASQRAPLCTALNQPSTKCSLSTREDDIIATCCLSMPQIRFPVNQKAQKFGLLFMVTHFLNYQILYTPNQLELSYASTTIDDTRTYRCH